MFKFIFFIAGGSLVLVCLFIIFLKFMKAKLYSKIMAQVTNSSFDLYPLPSSLNMEKGIARYPIGEGNEYSTTPVEGYFSIPYIAKPNFAHFFQITYLYEFNQKKYTGNFQEDAAYIHKDKNGAFAYFKSYPNLSNVIEEHKKLLPSWLLFKKYPKDSKIPIFVNPSNPKESYIAGTFNRTNEFILLLICIFGILFLIVGLLL